MDGTGSVIVNFLEPVIGAFHLLWKRKSCSVGFSEARPRGTMGDQLRGVPSTCYPPALLLPGQERLNCHCWATLGPPHQLHLAIVTVLTKIQTQKTYYKTQIQNTNTQNKFNWHCLATFGPPHQPHPAIVTMLRNKQTQKETIQKHKYRIQIHKKTP